jgi:hypothetical protein
LADGFLDWFRRCAGVGAGLVVGAFVLGVILVALSWALVLGLGAQVLGR